MEGWWEAPILRKIVICRSRYSFLVGSEIILFSRLACTHSGLLQRCEETEQGPEGRRTESIQQHKRMQKNVKDKSKKGVNGEQNNIYWESNIKNKWMCEWLKVKYESNPCQHLVLNMFLIDIKAIMFLFKNCKSDSKTVYKMYVNLLVSSSIITILVTYSLFVTKLSIWTKIKRQKRENTHTNSYIKELSKEFSLRS